MTEYMLKKNSRDRIFGYLIYKHLTREGDLEVKTDATDDMYTGHLYATIDNDFYFNVEINKRDLVICSGFKNIAFDDYVMSLENLSMYAYSITEGVMPLYSPTSGVGSHYESAIKAEITRNFFISFKKYKQHKKEGR